MVRPVRQTGPLREAAGFSCQEFSNLERPLALRADPFQAASHNHVMYGSEFLMIDKAKPRTIARSQDSMSVAYNGQKTLSDFGSSTGIAHNPWLIDKSSRFAAGSATALASVH
jgi:hypothetical protein